MGAVIEYAATRLRKSDIKVRPNGQKYIALGAGAEMALAPKTRSRPSRRLLALLKRNVLFGKAGQPDNGVNADALKKHADHLSKHRFKRPEHGWRALRAVSGRTCPKRQSNVRPSG